MKSFDKASTTNVCPEILAKYCENVLRFNTHPDSDYQLSQIREDVKNKIRQLLNINHQICFTSGGTESNNLAIIGFAKKFSSKKHFITTSYEHPSVLKSFQYLETLGHEVTYLDPNQDGIISPIMLQQAIKDDTVMVSIMAINNELGSFNDIKTLIKTTKSINPHITFMSDCVQAIMYLDLEVLPLIDIFVVSSHKIHGLKGVGMTCFKPEIKLQPILCGGHNEHGLRPGTQDLAREIAFLQAIEKFVVNRKENNFLYLKQQLTQIANISINCDSYTHIINISVNTNMLGEALKNALYQQGYMCSTKSACASMVESRSNTLKVLGLSDTTIDHSIRISVDQDISKEDIDLFIKTLKTIIKE